MRVLATVLLAVAAVSGAAAQPAPTQQPFSARLAQSRTALAVDAAGLHGPGSTVLAHAITQARYVLIGEDHLSREIPLFTAGVCRLMAPDGLDALAVEIGPEAASIVNAALRRPDRERRIASFLQAHPDAFAFQNGRDESAMAATCAAQAGKNFELWGLDQEFLGASGLLFERMLAAGPGSAARTAIVKLAAIERADTEAALASGSPADLFVYRVTDPQLAQAASAIRRDGGPRVDALFDALMETRAIYLSQNHDGFASNGQRARLMKRTLVRYLAARHGSPRLLFKFGDAHMGKGTNGLGQRDLGNFVAERAEGEGTMSLHIAVFGLKGVHALYGGVGRQVRQEPFQMAEDSDYGWLRDVASLPGDPGAGGEWSVIDLRLLRRGAPADMPQPWRSFANRYDLLVVAPELTPSTLLGAK